MNQIEKLDQILTGLAYHKESLDNHGSTGYMIKELCEILKMDISENEASSLENKLYQDGHIQYLNKEMKLVFNLSPKGYEFYLNGGYEKEKNRIIEKEEADLMQKRLIKSSLTLNKWQKASILLSLLMSSLAITLALLTYLKN